jgi:hypothetical protein
MRNEFSSWSKWCERNNLQGLQSPGVYAIALSKVNMSGTPFAWCEKIIYIGMTNSKGGLKSRLQQFENALKPCGGAHGGAQRVHLKYPDYQSLNPKLYVSVWPYECDVQSNASSDLRIMGDVAKCEYECFAQFVDMFGQLPEFNDKKKSPKK